MSFKEGAGATNKPVHSLDSQDPNTDANNQYLTFITAGEEYGVDILCVQEIRGWESVTPLPKSPTHLKGVINLRGNIVPIINLRQCFGLEEIDYNGVTVVIVLKLMIKNAEHTMGIVVDAVSDVYSLSEEDMRPAPDLGKSTNTDYIKSLVNVSNKLVILLDVEKLFGFAGTHYGIE